MLEAHTPLLTSSNFNDGLVLTSLGLERSAENGSLLFAWNDLVGVNRNQDVLNFITYPKSTLLGVAWCGNCANGGGNKEMKRTRKEIRVKMSNQESATGWEDKIWKEHLVKNLYDAKRKIDRKFLCLINPKSGPGKAKQIFEAYCLPIFVDARIQCETIYTTYSNHAHDLVRDMKALDDYDGIVIVSGDGLFHEVLNGIMKRNDWESVIRNVPLGVIPGGSGNGLAHSLLHHSNENHSDLTANAFLIAKNYTSSFDVCAVNHFKFGRLYSFLSLEVGFIADVDLESEWMRFLGDGRFVVQVIRRLCGGSLRKVNGTLAWVGENVDVNYTDYWKANEGEVGSAKEPKLKYLTGDNVSSSNVQWETIQDDFYSIWGVNVAYMSKSSFVSPDSKHHDSLLKLTSVRKSKGSKNGRLKLLEYILGVEHGSHLKLDYVDQPSVKAFKFKPAKFTKSSKMAVDGEAVDMGEIGFEVLPKFAKILGAT